MNCVEAEGHLGLASVGALEPPERAELDRHLATCTADCRRLAARNAEAIALLFGALEPVAPPARLRRNLMAQVYAESIPEGRAGRPPLWRRLADRIPASRALTIAGTAGVAAAVAALVWVNTGGRTPAHHDLTYAVAGTTADPAVSGKLAYDPTDSLAVLTVRGLPSLPTDATAPRVYEVWLIPVHGAPIPAGFLTRQPYSEAWTAVLSADVRKYRTVAATIEPYGGSGGPTGTPVLTGALTGH